MRQQEARFTTETDQAHGRLYEVEEWIRVGRSVTVPEGFRKTPLRVAVKTGFHSLIELLLRHEESTKAKNEFLGQAVHMRRPDLVELAVKYGAETTSVSFVDALLSWDRSIASFFLERGADLLNVPFAQAFCERVRTALGCYIDCKHDRPDLEPQLQEQANIALRQFCREGNLKWVSLLMWIGADPSAHGPTLEYLDDPDMCTTALHEVCVSGHLDVLKRLKPDPNRDGLGSLLLSAAMFGHQDIISYLPLQPGDDQGRQLR